MHCQVLFSPVFERNITKFIICCSPEWPLTLSLLVLSADNIFKQFGSRSGSKLFDTLIVFLKEFFEKSDFEKYQHTTKKHGKLPSRQTVKGKKTYFVIHIICESIE